MRKVIVGSNKRKKIGRPNIVTKKGGPTLTESNVISSTNMYSMSSTTKPKIDIHSSKPKKPEKSSSLLKSSKPISGATLPSSTQSVSTPTSLAPSLNIQSPRANTSNTISQPIRQQPHQLNSYSRRYSNNRKSFNKNITLAFTWIVALCVFGGGIFLLHHFVILPIQEFISSIATVLWSIFIFFYGIFGAVVGVLGFFFYHLLKLFLIVVYFLGLILKWITDFID